MALTLVGLDSNASATSSLNVTFDEDVAAGSSLVILCQNNDKRNVDSVTSTSLSFTERTDSSSAAIYDDIDTAVSKSTGDTITINYSSSAGRGGAIIKFAGIATYKTSTSTSGNGTSPSINRTTGDGVAAGDDVVGQIASQDASAISTPSGWTELYNFTVGTWRFAAHKKENVAAATQTYDPVCTGGKDYGIAMAVYTPPSGGSTQTLTSSLFTNSQTFYNPTIAPGAVTLTSSLFTNSQTFYTPSAVLNLTSALFTNTQTFYDPVIAPGAVTLTSSLFTNNQTFYDPTIAPGAVTLTSSLFTNTQSFFDPTIAPGAVTLASSLFTNNQTFYNPTIAPGAVTLTSSLFTNNQTFYTPVIVQGSAASSGNMLLVF